MITIEQYRARYEGVRVGERTMLKVERVTRREGQGVLEIRVVCDCGRVDMVKTVYPPSIGKRCRECGLVRARLAVGQLREEPATSRENVLAEIGDADPDVWRAGTDASIESVARITETEGPFTFEEVGALLGFTAQAAQQIEQRALRKLQRLVAGVGAWGERGHRWGKEARAVLEAIDERGPTMQELIEIGGSGV